MENRGFVLAVVLILAAAMFSSSFYSGPTGHSLQVDNVETLDSSTDQLLYEILSNKEDLDGDGYPEIINFGKIQSEITGDVLVELQERKPSNEVTGQQVLNVRPNNPSTICGDNICHYTESCVTCPNDCMPATGFCCGDGICGQGEAISCHSDCQQIVQQPAQQPPDLSREIENYVKRKFTLAVLPNLNSNDISVFDTIKNVEVARVDVIDGVKPLGAAMSKSGDYAYIFGRDSDFLGGERIWKLNLNTLTIDKTIYLPDSPFFSIAVLEISPDDRWLIATSPDKATINIIDTYDDTVKLTTELCTICDGVMIQITSYAQIAFSPDSRYVYVTDTTTQLIHIIELSTQTITQTIPLQYGGGYNIQILASSDGNALYTLGFYCVFNECPLRVYDIHNGYSFVDLILPPTTTDNPSISSGDMQFDPKEEIIAIGDVSICWGTPPCSGAVRILDLETLTFSTIPAADAVTRLRFLESSNQLWAVVSESGAMISAEVYDYVTEEQITSFPIYTCDYCPTPAFGQDKKYYYVVDYGHDSIQPINTDSFQPEPLIGVGDNPRGIYMQGDNSI